MKRTKEVICCDSCGKESLPLKTDSDLNGPVRAGWAIVCRYWYNNYKQLYFCGESECIRMSATILRNESGELSSLNVGWHKPSRIMQDADLYAV